MPKFNKLRQINRNSYYFALAKKYLEDVLKRVIRKEVIKVKVENSGTDELQKSIKEVVSKLDNLKEELEGLFQKDNQAEVIKAIIPLVTGITGLDESLKFLGNQIVDTYQGSFDKLDVGEDLKTVFGEERIFKVDVQNQLSLDNLSKSLEEVKRVLSRVQKVDGEVKIKNPINAMQITKLPKIQEFNDLALRLDLIKKAVEKIKIPEVKIPDLSNPKQEVWLQKIVESLTEVKEGVDNIQFPEINIPKTISVDNFPPQKIPNPVTHFSLNALKGSVKTSAVTVTISATKLPSIPLSNRRGMLIYNNSASTIYIGTSDVGAGHCFPFSS